MAGLSARPLGRATATVGMAWLSVHSFSLEPCSSRARIPVATISPAAITAATPNIPSFRRETVGRCSVGMRSLRCGGGFGALFLVYHTEHHGDKHQRRDGREDQPADHGAAERRVLLTALAEPQRHRRHADNHRQRGHQHRAEPDETGLNGGCNGIAELFVALAREADHQHALAVATPMHMMAPVSAGTDSVVWVVNSIQTMPASAAGSAVMITNGSDQD